MDLEREPSATRENSMLPLSSLNLHTHVNIVTKNNVVTSYLKMLLTKVSLSDFSSSSSRASSDRFFMKSWLFDTSRESKKPILGQFITKKGTHIHTKSLHLWLSSTFTLNALQILYGLVSLIFITRLPIPLPSIDKLASLFKSLYNFLLGKFSSPNPRWRHHWYRDNACSVELLSRWCSSSRHESAVDVVCILLAWHVWTQYQH